MVFIHRSIKTRIETTRQAKRQVSLLLFLYIDPLKQGLKQACLLILSVSVGGFYT